MSLPSQCDPISDNYFAMLSSVLYSAGLFSWGCISHNKFTSTEDLLAGGNLLGASCCRLSVPATPPTYPHHPRNLLTMALWKVLNPKPYLHLTFSWFINYRNTMQCNVVNETINNNIPFIIHNHFCCKKMPRFIRIIQLEVIIPRYGSSPTLSSEPE